VVILQILSAYKTKVLGKQTKSNCLLCNLFPLFYLNSVLGAVVGAVCYCSCCCSTSSITSSSGAAAPVVLVSTSVVVVASNIAMLTIRHVGCNNSNHLQILHVCVYDLSCKCVLSIGNSAISISIFDNAFPVFM
jgi:hypothetical protein